MTERLRLIRLSSRSGLRWRWRPPPVPQRSHPPTSRPLLRTPHHTAGRLLHPEVRRLHHITAFRYLVLKPICFLTSSNYEFFVPHYILEFFCSPTHSRNYLKYPAALDCHSAHRLLPEITQPTLIVSGMLDILTPSYASYEMNKLLPNSELHCETFGTHFVLREYPDKCGKWIKEFRGHVTGMVHALWHSMGEF